MCLLCEKQQFLKYQDTCFGANVWAVPGTVWMPSQATCYEDFESAILSSWYPSGFSVTPGDMLFYDGTTQLNIEPVNIVSNQVNLTASGLSVGPHTITAVYTGDADYTTATSNALTEMIENFTFGSSGGGTVAPQTAQPGGKATYALAVDPPSGTTFPEAVTFAVTGLPTGATATFSPKSVPANSGPTNVTMTVTLPSQSAAALPLPKPFGGEELPMALTMVQLPFAGRMRKGARRWKNIVFVLLLGTAGVALLASLSGCGSSGGSGSSGGALNPPPQTYALTITATSGSLTQSITTSLTVQ